MFEVSSIRFSHRRATITPHGRLPRRQHITACRPDQITQQPGEAEVRILVENLYKFKDFGAEKLIRELSDKGSGVKSLNNLLKKLRDSGSMTRRTRSGRRRTVPSDASLVFTRYSQI